MSIRPSEVRHYAVAGAQARLDTLRAEVATLIRTFPELQGSPGPAGDTSDRLAASVPGRKRGRRRTMTSAQRKAVSERMSKYWAGRRKAKAGKRGRATALKTAKPPASE